MNIPLKTHGGKHYLASRIWELAPRHVHYVEPYCGGCAVLLARDPDDERLWLPPNQGVSEVVNDINFSLINFWRVIGSEVLFPEFARRVQSIPLSRQEWEDSGDCPGVFSKVTKAVDFFVHCRQSYAGRMKQFTAITRTRTRRRMNGNVSEWLSAVDGLPEVHARLRRVLVEDRPALDVIRSEDGPGTLIYADPPYLHETRVSTDAYAHEMDFTEHESLLYVIKQCRGKVMLSGYPSELYDAHLKGWTRHTFDISNHASGGKTKRRMTEVLWCNF